MGFKLKHRGEEKLFEWQIKEVTVQGVIGEACRETGITFFVLHIRATYFSRTATGFGLRGSSG